MQTETEKMLSMPRFEPGSLGRTTDPLANYATPPLQYYITFVLSVICINIPLELKE
jgi:hypothetical protein